MTAAVADAAYQGAPGAFSEDAARALLGESVELLACQTLDDVFAAVAAGRARAAVVPIENSLAGAVPGCADLIGRQPVHITGERIQHIAHALIAARGVSLPAVRRVLSHPVAIAQCEGFFRSHPAIKPVPVFDTAGAVAEVVEGSVRDAAAIAGRRAAAVYGGVVLAADLQDSQDNFTRFLLIEPGPTPDRWQAGYKTSLLFTLRNMPGALARALAPFAARGLNLSRIESRPVKDMPFAYAFHIDVGPADDASLIGAAIDDLGAQAQSVRILGHYPGSR